MLNHKQKTLLYKYYQVVENIMEISSRKELGDSVIVYTSKGVEILKPSYSSKLQNNFLLDLRKILPDSIKAGDKVAVTHYKDIIPSSIAYKYYSDIVDINFSKNSLEENRTLHIVFRRHKAAFHR